MLAAPPCRVLNPAPEVAVPALAHVLLIKSQRLTLAAIFWERSNSCICGQRYYSLGRMEIYVRSSSVPSFPDWLKWEAIREQAKELWEKLPTEKDPAKAQQVLEQLITNPLIDLVWGELYKKNRINHKSTGQYKYPACVTNVSRAARMRRRAAEVRQKGGKESEAKGWEYSAGMFESTKDQPADPRWSEQDRGAQLFLCRAYREYLDLKPVFLTDLKTEAKKFVEVAKVLRRQATTLQELKNDDAAQKLEQIASDCDSHAKRMLPSSRVMTPGLSLAKLMMSKCGYL